MSLDEIWLAYVNSHMDENAATTDAVEFRASQTLELFFDTHSLFSKRWGAIQATAFNAEFDGLADDALARVSMDDSFASWEQLPAGVWRVISDRLMYCEICLSVVMAQDDRVTDHLPQGLRKDQQLKALLLKYLLGHGRTIDRHVLPEQVCEQSSTFPSQLPLRPQ